MTALLHPFVAVELDRDIDIVRFQDTPHQAPEEPDLLHQASGPLLSQSSR